MSRVVLFLWLTHSQVLLYKTLIEKYLRVLEVPPQSSAELTGLPGLEAPSPPPLLEYSGIPLCETLDNWHSRLMELISPSLFFLSVKLLRLTRTFV